MAEVDGSIKLKIVADDSDISEKAPADIRASYEKLSKDIVKSMSQVVKCIETLNENLTNVSKNTGVKGVGEQSKQTALSMDKVNDKLAKAWNNEKQLAKTADEWQYKLDALANKEVEPKSILKLQGDLAATEKQIEKLDNEFQKMSEEQSSLADKGIKIDGKIWYSDSDKERMRELDELIIKNGQDTDALKQKAFELSDTISSIKLDSMASEEAKQLAAGIEKARNRIVELNSASAETPPIMENAKNTSNEEFSVMQSGAKKVYSGIQKLISGFFEMTKQGAKAFLHINSSSNILKKGLDSANNSLNGIIKRTMKLLKNIFVFRIISASFRNLKTGISELVKKNNVLNASLLSIKTNLYNAFASIWDTVLPVIQTLIIWIDKLTAAFARAIQTLFGVSDSVSDVQEAFGQNNKDKKSMASFDELNIISSSDADKNSSQAVSKKDYGISDTFAKIKTAIEQKDWKGLGKLLADKINGLFENVSNNVKWDTVGGKITEVISGITQIFNSMVDNIDWDNIGNTLGEGINTIINTENSLLEGVDWTNFGEGIGSGLNETIDTIDWDELGRNFSLKVNSVFGTINGFVHEFDWENLGLSLSDGLNSIFDNTDWIMISDTLSTGLNGIIHTLNTFLENVNWKENTRRLMDSINRFISNVRWEDIGRALSNFFGTVLEVLYTAAQEFDWEGLGKAIADFINGIDFKRLISGAIKLITSVTAGLFTALSAAINNIDWLELGEEIVNGFASVDWKTEFKRLFLPEDGFLTDTVKALYQKIKKGISDFEKGGTGEEVQLFPIERMKTNAAVYLECLKQYFIDPVSRDYSSLQDIIEKSTDDTYENISDKWKPFSKFFDDSVKTPVTNSSNDMKTNIKTSFEEAYSNITEKWSDAKGWFGTEVRDKIKSVFEETKENTQASLYNALTKVKEIWTSPDNWFNENVKDKIKTVFDTVKDNTENSLKKALDNIHNAWTNPDTWFNDNVLTPLSNTFKNIKSKIVGFLCGTGDGQTDTGALSVIKGKWGELSGWFTEYVAAPIKIAFETVSDGIKKIFNNLYEKIKSPINTVLSGIENFINSIIKGINKLINGINAIGDLASIIGIECNIDYVPEVKIPRLAQGTVVPPNKEFMAVLGDNKTETEVVSPLSTMKQAFNDALQESGFNSGNRGGNVKVVLELNGYELAKGLMPYMDSESRRLGTNLVM